MKALGKMVIGSILASAVIVVLSRAAAIFPFYMAMVTEAFNIANIVSADNYIKEQYYDDALETLQERPLFNNPNTNDAEIYVLNSAGIATLHSAGDNVKSVSNFGDGWAVGSNDEYEYIGTDGTAGKPYRQRGEPVKIIITAEYPFEFTLWGQTVSMGMPVSFSMTTNGMKYYKDLPMDNPYAIGTPEYIDYYDTTDW